GMAQQLAESTRLLRREELTVVRPLLRRGVRSLRRRGRRFSPERQQALRALLAPVVVRIAPRSAQAAVYTRARELRSGRVIQLPELVEVSTGEYRLPPSPRSDALDFVILPVIDWHFRHQRPQQIATHLADLGHRV